MKPMRPMRPMPAKRSLPRATLRLLLVGAGAAALLVAGPATLHCSRSGNARDVASEAAIWYCPMHPTYTSDGPGDCPICHMRLVKLEKQSGGVGAPPAGAGTGAAVAPSPVQDAPPSPPRKRIVYRSTMNPNETSNSPGKDSMGMEMVPMEVPATESASSGITGWAEVVLPPERLQQSGITFGTIATKRMARTLRTSGRVTYNEARFHHVHTKLSGWIEHLAVDTVGVPVRRGDPLFDLYAPELLAAQEEYLQALKAERDLGPSSNPDLARGVHDLREAARRRLTLWDFGPEAVARLDETRQAARTITIRAPISGVVTAKEAVHGMYADPASILYTIADLSRVWVLADVYENELSLVHAGSTAEVRLPYDPGVVRRGRVALVSPVLDPATRTARVRIEIDNPSLALRPDMFADVIIATDAGDRTVVPKSAVVRTGERSIVFVDRGEGRISPREITVGLRFEDDLEVISGLAPGERVVTSATFVVDSESRLRASVVAAAPPPASGSAPPAPSSAPRSPAPAPEGVPR